MCGITGIYSKDNIPNIEERIQKMNFSIVFSDFKQFKFLMTQATVI